MVRLFFIPHLYHREEGRADQTVVRVVSLDISKSGREAELTNTVACCCCADACCKSPTRADVEVLTTRRHVLVSTDDFRFLYRLIALYRFMNHIIMLVQL